MKSARFFAEHSAGKGTPILGTSESENADENTQTCRTQDVLGVDVAGDRTAIHDFLLDVLIANHTAIFGHLDLGVVLDRVAAIGGVAGHAGVNRRAVAISGHVLLAGHVGDAVEVDPAHSSVDIATVARASRAAVQKHLDGGNHVALGAVRQNFDSVGDGGNSGVCPAGTAANLRNELVRKTVTPALHTKIKYCSSPVNRDVLIQISSRQTHGSPVPRSRKGFISILGWVDDNIRDISLQLQLASVDGILKRSELSGSATDTQSNHSTSKSQHI